MGRLVDADPLATAIGWLTQRPAVSAALGGDGRISARNEPPYPCVRITDPPGNDRTLTHLIAPLLQIEVLGDLDGSPGKPMLRRILYTILDELILLPEQAQTVPGQAVVTAIVSTGGGGWAPEPNGQPRYLATVQMYLHPGVSA